MSYKAFLGCAVSWMVSVSLSGCEPPARAASAPRDEAGYTYPPGPWRLAPFKELDRTVLWVSHIVVMSEASQPLGSRLRNLGWQPDSLPTRSAQAARALIERVK